MIYASKYGLTSHLDDLSPGQLWLLLTDDERAGIFDGFFRDQSAELAGLLDEDLARRRAGVRTDCSQLLGDSFRRLWHEFRDRKINRLAADGQILHTAEEGL
ncbi:MAG TPA: hypothetical protein VMD30_10080 [Tepidisphaeraceae bacterium]|nr:hypothetical protein [Tepidisphaeraceae bacterium]